jgi:subtilase family serine protease
MRILEHYHKHCRHAVGKIRAAVLLGFGFVFAQLQAAAGMRLRSASPKHQNSSLPHGYSIYSNARGAKIWFGFILATFLLPGLAQATQFLPHHQPAAVRQLNLKSTGRLPASAQVNLVIGLPWRNREALTNLLQDLYNPSSPKFHHYLTPAQFAEQFGPTTNDYNALATFIAAHGLTINHRHPNHMLLDVSGPAAAVENTLHVHLLTYRHPTEKRDFFAPDTEPSLDAPIQILDINGLDNYASRECYAHLDTNFPTAFDGPTPYAGSGIGGLYIGYDYRDAYMPNVTLTGVGQSIGLFEMDGYNVSDITAYEQQAGLTNNVTLTNVFMDSITNNVAGPNALEDTLDIDMALAMAPAISRIIVYEGTNTADILNQMATDDFANQLSSSWKPFDASALTDQALQELAAQGQSMFQADGDTDAQPAMDITQPSSPYETLVGGTSLTTRGGLGSWVAESVWNRGAGTGTGGGISDFYPIPYWQTNVITATNQGSTSFRNSPDVALVSSNILVVIGGITGKTGGTSAAAPLWAGVTALINQQASQHGLPPVGFLNPAFYAIGMGPNYQSCFHDVTVGNNFSSSSPSEFSAEPGYDLCTGWGTPAGQSLIDALMPFLSITASGNQLLITWPQVWASADLQQNSNLATTNWVAVTNTVNIVNDQFQVAVSPGGSNEFFHLALP